MDRARILTVLAGVGLAMGTASADTWTVPSAQTPTLQFALESGSSPVHAGDTIELLETGFYLSAYTVSTPDLTIRAAPGQTIVIDALGLGSVFTIQANNVTLEDLTLTGGDALTDGGAIYLANGLGHTLTVTNCVLDDNETALDGGAVYIGSGSTLIMSGCAVTNNRATTGGVSDGGALRLSVATAFIDDCDFIGNSAAQLAGAISSQTGVLDITNCTFKSNHATVGGAMQFLSGTNGTVQDCLFYDNDSDNNGGAIDCNSSWPDFFRCRFIENHAIGDGGAIFVIGETGENLDLVSCVLAGNTAGGIGGGWAAVSGPDSAVTNCTIVGNTSATGGGGLDDNGTGAGTGVRNCIIRGNTPNQFPGIPTNVARYCNVEGGAGGTAMIDADPLFVDADGLDDDPMTFLDNDYRLSPGSASIDAGDSTLLSATYPLDIDLNNRAVDDPNTPDTGVAIFFQTVDQGAFEFQPPVGGPPPACNGADLDGNGQVDVADFGIFALQFGCGNE